MNNELRWGRFSSSNIGDLMKVSKDKTSFGAPALSLIEEKRMERKLKRVIGTQNDARPFDWGRSAESIAFEKLGTQYVMCSDETIVNKDLPYHCGTPDLIKHTADGIVVADIKCPFTLKSFCTFVDAYEEGGIEEVRKRHPDGDKYYYQLVSNAILTECTKAELVIFMPYLSELSEVKINAELFPFQWLVFAHESSLPYLLEDGHYKNINVMPFDIPQSDIDLLTANVIKANELCGYTDFLNPKS